MGGMESKEDLQGQAILPESLEVQTVRNMCIGDAKIARWGAMVIDSDRRSWLIPKFPVFDEPNEARQLIIIRTKLGFVVDTSLIKEPPYEPEEDLSIYQVGEHDWIPVKFIFQEPTLTPGTE